MAGPRARAAAEADLEAVAAIYAHYVEHTAATFDLAAPTPAEWRAKWADAQRAGYPWAVLEDGGAVAGYAAFGSFRPKPAWRPTVESTIYLAPAVVGRGLGRPLYEHALGAAAAAGFHIAVAGITLPNRASVALHEALGFTPVGVIEEAGHKLGGWRDVGWWQKRLGALRPPGAATRSPGSDP